MRPLSKSSWDHICESDMALPKERATERTVFHLVNPSAKTRAMVADSADMAGNVNLSGSMGRVLMEECLTGWDNFRDDDGKEIDFPTKKFAALDMLPGKALTELALTVWKRCQLGEDDRKN